MTGSRIRTMAATVAAIVCASSAAKADLMVSSKPTQNVSCSSGTCTATAKKAVLNAGDLTAMLGSSDVTVSTGGIAKDIKISSPLSWASASRLTLDADRSLIVKRPVTVAGSGALTLSSNGGGKNVDLTFSGGSVTFWDLSSSLIINGVAYALVGNVAQLADGISQNNQGLYALARTYDAASDGTYASAPVPMPRSRGVVEGLGNTIANLSVDVSSHGAVAGLFADNQGTIRDLDLHNETVVANGQIKSIAGALAPWNHGVVANSSADGNVTAGAGSKNGSYAGGLIGVNEGEVIHSRADVTVNSELATGGLIGLNDFLAKIETSHAVGSATGGKAGGLVGSNLGPISQSFATGSASAVGGDRAGGLVGLNGGRIDNSYATGNATGIEAGGLVGDADNSIGASYSTGMPSGTQLTGGVIGIDAGNSCTSCYWDLDTSGVSDPSQGAGQPPNDPGITGLTTAQFLSGLPAGFDPSIWGQLPTVNGGYPYLLANPPE